MKEKERGREWKTHFFSSSPLPQPELDAVPLFLLPFNSSTFPYPATVKVSVSRKKRLFFFTSYVSHISPSFPSFQNSRIETFPRAKKRARSVINWRGFAKTANFDVRRRKESKNIYPAPHNQENGLTKPFPPCSLGLFMHAKQAAPFLNPHDLSEPFLFSPCVSN